MNLVALAYKKWQKMPQDEVLDEMAVLFHLAVKIEEVKLAEKAEKRRVRK